MRSSIFLIIILFVSAFGLLFSGYLSYLNVFNSGCSEFALISCGRPGDQVLIFKLPTCVYGFFMYLAVFVLTSLGLLNIKRRLFSKIIFGLGVFGTLFAGSLSYYEIFILKIKFIGFPACVIGLIFYFAIGVMGYFEIRSRNNISGESSSL